MPKFLASGLLALALLEAQQLTDAERQVAARIDDALGVHPGAVIADIGTGPALTHPIRIAEKVGPNGKVVCVDVQLSAVARIKDYAAAHHLTNIEAVLGQEDDPLLATGTYDAILISNTYHEFTQPALMLKHIHDSLKPHGRLVVVELYSGAHKGEPRGEQTKRHDIPPDILDQELSAAGFAIKERIDPVQQVGVGRSRYLFEAEKSE